MLADVLNGSSSFGEPVPVLEEDCGKTIPDKDLARQDSEEPLDCFVVC